MRRIAFTAIVVGIALALLSAASGFIGYAIGAGVLHPANMNPQRLDEAERVFERTTRKNRISPCVLTTESSCAAGK